MEFIFNFIQDFILTFFMLLFYQKSILLPMKRVVVNVIFAFSFAICAALAGDYFSGVLRIISGIFILGSLLFISKMKLNWTALILVFLLVYFIELIVSLVIATLLYMIGFHNEIIILYICLLLGRLLGYFISYKAIKLKNGIPAVFDSEFSVFILIFSGLLFSLMFLADIIGEITKIIDLYANTATDLVLFYVTWLGVGLVALALLKLVQYLSKKQLEKIALADELSEKEEEFNHKADELMQDIKNLSKNQHKYRSVVNSVQLTYDDIVDEIEGLKKYGGEVKQIDALRKRVNVLNNSAMEISEEFVVDDLDVEIGSLNFAFEFLLLESFIRLKFQECSRDGVRFNVVNNSTLWSELSVSDVQLTKLMGNLVGNAMKEVAKLGDGYKSVNVVFSDTCMSDVGDMFFRIEIFDNAAHFPVEILARLGERGNSTNGTGDGYAEVFEFLEMSGASWMLSESRCDDLDSKVISVTFDGMGRIGVKSQYRRDELSVALVGSRVEVL